jgi:hypothetical protein
MDLPNQPQPKTLLLLTLKTKLEQSVMFVSHLATHKDRNDWAARQRLFWTWKLP